MQIGSEVAIHARGDGGSVGEAVGTGKIIHPQVVQVAPPLDAELSRVARQAGEFVIVTPEGNHEVFRIRPGLVGYDEAVEIASREQPGAEFVETQTGIVAFEIKETLGEDDGPVGGDPWICRVICLDFCKSC
ncbi:hypothetical protein GCM10011575_23000 [Microlunatus endophyticus]|uniref:Uncharacterized protein n=1 Tax=Microlunatus endophyticus TaxID=1716077 RepID=A0A917W4Y8_9ACTN|nr:hypothetical protein [Microlunatus endophyticus]GGL63975.1 hypothetical protein GCM10011575_23000 [Microlunatus endophyticus]